MGQIILFSLKHQALKAQDLVSEMRLNGANA